MKMAKKNESPKVEKVHRKRDNLLKVSKAAKIMATFQSLRGFNFRETILALGEAERTAKETGRLILGGKASS